MRFPTPYTVDVLPYVAAADDAYGNDTPSWGAAVEQPVYGWAPAGTTEVNTWRHAVTADLTLYAPPEFTAASRDRVVLDGDTYDVQGEPEDYNHGPFGGQPGFAVNLTRAEAS